MVGSRGRWAGGVIVAFLATFLTACGGGPPGPSAVAQRFVAAWDRGDWSVMDQYVDGAPADFVASGPKVAAGLRATSATHLLGALTHQGAGASIAISSTYQLPGFGPWTVQSTLPLRKQSGHWLVEWSPAVVDAALQAGQRLTLADVWAPRAQILGAGGTPLTTQGAVVVVGVEGSRIHSDSQVTAALTAAGASESQVSTALAAAHQNPTYFEPVFDLAEAKYQAIGGDSSQLYKVQGTVFQHTAQRQAATPGLAAHLVGTIGPITAQELGQLGPPYDATAIVGQTGLEQVYEKELAGAPGGHIEVLNANGQTVSTVASFAPRPGKAISTTIDLQVQQAAEAALAGISGNGALVAVRASTGQVLADESVPEGYGFDQGLGGEFPPGSTFKMITSTALIEKGLSPSSPASCPPTISVDGESFHNAEGDAPVSTIAGAFTESCNTAFISLATSNLQAGSLPAAAALYDLGSKPNMGMPMFGGNVPTPKDQAGLAQTAIGQAQVVVSPLAMAMVAAALDTGTVRSPRLVDGAPDDTAPTHTVPPLVLSDLQQMMLSVVTSGTAAGTGLPAGTHAKTGTAQYGPPTPPRTDAWLVGYDGDIAFAAVIQGTGNGGPTDGPIVAKFLKALPAAELAAPASH